MNVNIMGKFAKGIAAMITFYSGRKARNHPMPAIKPAHFDAVMQAQSDCFTVGYGKAEIMPAEDVVQHKYWIAGYRINNRCEGILDPMTAHAVWIDDNSGKGGIVLVSVDCVGLLRKDVEAIKNRLSGFVKRTGCRSISIMSTHTHAGIDTMGMWGPLPKTGRNPAFMKIISAGVEQCVEQAYESRRAGDLYWGKKAIHGVQKDSRLPEVFCEDVTRVRFVPQDGGREIYLINFAAHPESMGGHNSLVSADFPCYLAQEIEQRTGADTIYFSGAIGGLIAMQPLSEDTIESTRLAGQKLAEAACSIEGETKLSPRISLIRQEFYVDADNYILLAAAKIGIIQADAYATGKGTLNVSLKTELTYLEIDRLKILMIPGEIYPELVYGGYLNAKESAQGAPASVNPLPLREIANEEDLVVFGLANDEIGYIVTPNDFCLNRQMPYLDKAIDRLGRKHYEETNSLGPNTATRIAEVFAAMMETVRKAKQEAGQGMQPGASPVASR